MIALAGTTVDRKLEPKLFCELYAKAKEGEYGYKGNWTRLLAHALAISHKSIERWGSPPDFVQCPERYKKELSRIHALKIAEQVLRDHELNREFLDRLE